MLEMLREKVKVYVMYHNISSTSKNKLVNRRYNPHYNWRRWLTYVYEFVHFLWNHRDRAVCRVNSGQQHCKESRPEYPLLKWPVPKYRTKSKRKRKKAGEERMEAIPCQCQGRPRIQELMMMYSTRRKREKKRGVQGTNNDLIQIKFVCHFNMSWC